MDWARILAYVTGTVDQELPALRQTSSDHGIDLPSRAEAGQGVAGAGRLPDVAGRRVRAPG